MLLLAETKKGKNTGRMNDRREIKFRAWNKNEECFFYWDTSFAFGGTGKAWGEIEQYTGLKDKNDKEIYEGDICKVDDGDNIYEVIFYMGGFRLAVLPRKIRVYDIGNGLFKNIEIIETTYKFMDTAKQDAERNP
jgi:hypothetical protein